MCRLCPGPGARRWAHHHPTAGGGSGQPSQQVHVSREHVGGGRALGQLSVFSRRLESSPRAATPSPPPPLSCLCESRGQGQAACPAPPCPVTSPAGRAGTRLPYQMCPRGVTRGPPRSRERATGTFIPRGNHVQAPGGARPVHQPQVCVSGSSVFKGIGVFLSVFFKVIFIGFTCFTMLCLYCRAERVSSAFTNALCSGFPSQLGYHRALRAFPALGRRFSSAACQTSCG